MLAECRLWATVTYLADGIAGGMTQTERIKLRRRLREAGFPIEKYKQEKQDADQD